MILTSSILLLATLGLVEPYQQFDLNVAPSGYNFNNVALTSPQFQNQPQLQPQLQQQFRPNPVVQMDNNAQRFYMQPFQLRNQGFSPMLQQNQQRQIPFEVRTRPQQLQQPQQALSYFGPQQQQPQMRLPLLPSPAQQAPLPVAPIQQKKSAVSVQPPPDKDFISSLQIIDNHGQLRNLKDFGLGGSGDQPVNPELEKSLRSIFETINRDLENAEFLPLAMNGAQQQLGNMFRDKPPSQIQDAQNVQQRPINVETRGQAQQIEQQGQQPQQALGYAFQQPKQNQFQFLKPLRANKINQSPEQPIRSPAQALRSSKQQLIQVKDDQKLIENLPIQQENLDLPPTKNGPVVQKQQNDFEENTQTHEKASVGETKGRRQQPFIPQPPVKQQPRQEVLSQVQGPILPQTPRTQAPSSEQKPVQVPIQEQQQQSNLGFDDEPVELKAVERAPVHQSKGQLSVKQRSNQEQLGKKSRKELPLVAQTIEQAPLNQDGFEQQQQQPQQQFEDERTQQTKTQLQHPKIPFPQQQQYEEQRSNDANQIKSNVKKFEGWTPIVQRPQIYERPRSEPQQQQQQLFEQQRDEQGFDDQKPVFQEKDSGSFDQPKQEPEPIKNDFFAQQQEAPAPISQQPFASKGGGGRLVKLRKSLNKFAESAKSKLSSPSNSGLTQFQVEQQNIQQEKATQQQEQQIFDTLSNLQEANLDQGKKEQLSQEMPQLSKIQQQAIRSQEQHRYQSPPQSPAIVATSNSYNRPPRVQAQRQSTKSFGRQTSSKVTSPVRTNAQQLEESNTRQPQQQQEEIQSQLRQEEEEAPQQQRQQDNNQPQTQQQTQISQLQDDFSQGGLQQQPRPEAIFSQHQEEQFKEQQQPQQQQQQKLDDEPLSQQKQGEFIPQQKQDESSSQQKQEESFSQQKQEEILPQQKQEETLSQQKQEEPLSQQKQDEPLSQQKQDDFNPQQKQDEQLSQQKQDDFIAQQKQDDQLSQQKQEEAPLQQQQQQKEEVTQEQRVQQDEFSPQIQERQESQKKSEQQEQRVDEPVQQQQQQLQQKEPEEEPASTTTTTSTTSRPRQATKGKRKGQQSSEAKGAVRGKPVRPQRPNLLGEEKQQQKIQDGRQISQQQQHQENEGQNQQQEEVSTQTKIEDEFSTPISTTTTTPRQISSGLVEDQRTTSKGRSPIQKARQPQQAEQIEEKQQSVEQDRQEVQIQQQQKQQIENEPTQQQGSQQEDLGLTQVRAQDDSFSVAAATTTTTTTFRPRLQQTKRLRQEVYQAEKKAPTGQQDRGQKTQTPRAQLSAHQLLNTYNPLQFEPERISSLTRASQSSSQNTNVNSSPSADSY